MVTPPGTAGLPNFATFQGQIRRDMTTSPLFEKPRPEVSLCVRSAVPWLAGFQRKPNKYGTTKKNLGYTVKKLSGFFTVYVYI